MAWSESEKQRFWEHKILAWEEGRYQRNAAGGLLERLANRASDSLRFRLTSTAELLAPFVEGKRVVDMGCGSGRMAEPLLEAGAVSYVGVDIAESAITAANQRAQEAGWADRATFLQGDVHALADHPADVVISLGLTDWLTDEELELLFQHGGDAHFLHAISEQRRDPRQWLHRAYCWLAYGYRSEGYVPRYFLPSDLAAMAARHRQGESRIWRHPRLTFGAYVTSLPVGEPI